MSKDKGDWKYGKIDVRAKIPGVLGVWSAFGYYLHTLQLNDASLVFEPETSIALGFGG